MGSFGIVILVLWVIALAMGVFWLWMLIDVISKQEKDKIVWLLVILFLGPLGALLHYLIARKTRVAAMQAGGPV
jgi:hypothetical protein